MASLMGTSEPLKFEACVLVANIPLETNDEIFWESLQVKRVGLVLTRRMIADPRGLPYKAAFIEYASIRLAECARYIFRIKFKRQRLEVCCASEFLEWYSTFLTGENINVDVSLLHLVEVDCLGPSISDEDIEKSFSTYGKVSIITKKSPPGDESISRITLKLEDLLEGLKAELALNNSEISGSKLSVRSVVNLARIRSIIRHGEANYVLPDSELQYPSIPFFKEFINFEKMESGNEIEERKDGKVPDQLQDNINLACESSEEASENSHSRNGKHPEACLASAPAPQKEGKDLSDAVVIWDYGMPKRVPFRGFNVPEDNEPNRLSQGAAALFQFLKSTIPPFEKPIEVPVPDDELECSRIPEELKWIYFSRDWETQI